MTKTKTARKAKSKGKDTREQLVLAAITLFSDQGIRATSLRQVNEAAGTKNSGAVHYYFKNKLGLIGAAVAFTYSNMQTDIDDADLQSVGLPRVRDLRGVKRVVYQHFLPLLIMYEDVAWGKSAIGFLAHLMMEADPKVQEAWEHATRTGALSTIDQLHGLLPRLPRDQLERRYLFALVNLIHGLADSRALVGTGYGNSHQIEQTELIMELIDYVAAGIRSKQ